MANSVTISTNITYNPLPAPPRSGTTQDYRWLSRELQTISTTISQIEAQIQAIANAVVIGNATILRNSGF